MSTIAWQQLRAYYQHWQARNPTKLAAGPIRSLGWVVQHFPELLYSVRQQMGRAADELLLPLLLACCVVGPEAPDLPDDTCQQLVSAFAEQSAGDEGQWALDLAIAWGCGWGRISQPTASNLWDRRWVNAIFAFCGLVERSVHYTLKQIAQRVGQSGNVSELLQVQTEYEVNERIRGYAELIALEMIHQRCSCSLVDTLQQANCGQTAHQLASWQPAECSLAAFTAQAVRGRATAELLVGAFIKSALYPRLRADIGLLAGEVEFKRCATCGTLYETAHCPTPACTPLTVEAHSPYRLARKNWLLIPYEYGGSYQMIKRWHCRGCGTLFALNLPHCPRPNCGQPRPQRPTNIWLYTGKTSDKPTDADLAWRGGNES